MPYVPNVDKVLNKLCENDGKSEAEQFLKLQANRSLKHEHKKVCQMNDREKEMYAEMNREEIEAYERQFYIENSETEYENTDVFYSPIASIILDAFFTDGEH